MAPAREAAFTYQDVPLVALSGTRTLGTAPDAFEITLPARALHALRLSALPGGLYADLRARSGDRGGAAPGGRPRPLEGALEIRGDLVLSDGERTLSFLDLYVRDDGIEAIEEVDDEDGETIARVALTDIRYFWARRGELWGTYNVRLPDGAWDASTVKDEGKPYTLREILLLLCDRLPGRPRLVKLPERVKAAVPPDLVWRGKLPKDELDRLLETYRLTLNLTPGNEIELTDESEKPPEETRSGSERELGGATLPEGAWKRRRRRTFRHRPEAVRILGPRVVREVTVDRLEPVGYGFDPETGAPDETQLLSWEDAARLYGLSVEDLAAFVLQDDATQGAILERLGHDRRRAAELNRWAFRLFRLPRAVLGFLPILEARAETYRDPEGDRARAEALEAARKRLPPLVETETFEEVRRVDGPADRQLLRDRDTPRTGQTIAGISVDGLDRIVEKRARVVFVNRPIRPVEAAEIDPERGLVRFRDPVGYLPQQAIVEGKLQSKAQGRLLYPPRVRLTFAYEDSPEARTALQELTGSGLPEAGRGQREVQHHYSFLGARYGEDPQLDGRVAHLNSDLVDPPDAPRFPLVILDEAFRMFVTLDGRTNREGLDLRAEEIARQLLFGSTEVSGEEGEAMGFFDIRPSSRLSRVGWEGGAGITKTTWSLENVLAGKARLGAAAGVSAVNRRIERSPG